MLNHSRFEPTLAQTCASLRIESLPLLHALTTLSVCSEGYSLAMYDSNWAPMPLPLPLMRRIRALSVDWDLCRFLPFDKLNSLEVLTAKRVSIFPYSHESRINDETPELRLLEVLDNHIKMVKDPGEPDIRDFGSLLPSIRLLHSVSFCDESSSGEADW